MIKNTNDLMDNFFKEFKPSKLDENPLLIIEAIGYLKAINYLFPSFKPTNDEIIDLLIQMLSTRF